ncbi:MAG: hypothetical protein OSA98_01200 [Rubripirellula sp.]|nr:hypothetical protein [Rubripirellula sp.]
MLLIKSVLRMAREARRNIRGCVRVDDERDPVQITLADRQQALGSC